MMSTTEALPTISLDSMEARAAPGLTVQFNPGPPPDYSVELYRLFLAVEADAMVKLEGQTVCLKCGNLLTLSPGEVVQFDDVARVRSLSFHHDFFCVRVERDEVYCDGVVFNQLNRLPIVEFPAADDPVLLAYLMQMTNAIENRGPFTNDRVINALRGLLLHAADLKVRASETASEDDMRQNRLSPLVLRFQNLVEETFTKRKEASFYADTLGVTLVTLNRHVKEDLGKTVMQTVNERIAIEARVALRSGKRSIKQVAFDLGFDDPLYFSRFFRKQFGKPPSEYFANPIVDTP